MINDSYVLLHVLVYCSNDHPCGFLQHVVVKYLGEMYYTYLQSEWVGPSGCWSFMHQEMWLLHMMVWERGCMANHGLEGKKKGSDWPEPIAIETLKNGHMSRLHQWDMRKCCGQWLWSEPWLSLRCRGVISTWMGKILSSHDSKTTVLENTHCLFLPPDLWLAQHCQTAYVTDTFLALYHFSTLTDSVTLKMEAVCSPEI
jgi:hypothetical protein